MSAATKPYCEGGTGTCEVCVGSCGIEEYEARSAAEDQRHADLETLQNYLDWQYAINGGFGTASFHRTLVREERPMPTLYEAREAVARLRAES